MKVKCIRPVRCGGESHAVGAILDVTEMDAKILLGGKSAVLVSDSAKATATKPEEQAKQEKPVAETDGKTAVKRRR